MKELLKKFFIAALCVLAFSCTDVIPASDEETALPEGSIRFDINKTDNLARNAAPASFLNSIYYRLTIYKEGDEAQSVVTKYQKTLSFTVPAPSWTGASVARLEMYCPRTDSVTDITEGDEGTVTVNSAVCMTGKMNFDLKDGTRVFNFTIDLEIADGETSGTINLPVTVGNTGVKSCIIVPDYAGSDASKYIKAEVTSDTLKKDEVTPFSDYARFYFFEAAADDLEVSNDQLKNAKIIYSDSITVFPATTTDKWFTSDGNEKTVDLAALQYSTFYVAAASDNGDDLHGGSSLYPLNTVSAAILKCAQTQGGGTIYLKSQPADTEKIVIDKNVKIENISGGSDKLSLPNIEIGDESKVSLTGVKISKAGETGVSVGTNCSLILSNVEVSGCAKGIYAENKCTVDLSNDSAVKNCTGYGIMLKSAEGVLKISDTEVDAAKAETSSFDNCDLYYPKGKVVRLNAPCSDVSKNDDILKEAFDAVGGFGNGSVLLLGTTNPTSVTWALKENGILVTTGTAGNTYTVKPVNSTCNVTVKRDTSASKQFVLLKSTASGIWKINNFTFEGGSNTTQTDISLNSDGKGGALYLENGTLDLTSCSFTKNSAQNGGAVYIESGTVNLTECTIGGSSTANTAAENGGAFYLEGSSAKLVMNSGTIGNNTAKNGGGVYVASGAAAEIKGGRIISNSATTAGGAVYQGGTFEVSGNTYIAPGGAALANDVYLPSGQYIEAAGTLNPKANGSADGSNVDHTAAITPSEWKRGTQVLTGDYAATYAGKFKGSESDWLTVSDTDNKVKLYTGYKIYVAGSGHNKALGDGKTSADGGLGTMAKPYASIEEAVKQCWNKNQDFTVYLSGSLTGSAQAVPAEGLAGSIALEGVTGNTDDIINRNLTGDPDSGTGTALTINTAVPVTIKKIKITGGYKRNDGSGGGIYLRQKGAALTLGEGVLITGNSAAKGGGIYFVGTSASGGTATLTMESTAQISGNTALNADGKAGYGGGVYLEYANLCMSGKALIGDTTGSGAAEDSSKSNSAYFGGGVYGATGSNVYIGYNTKSQTDPNYPDTCGILHNYSSANGGGIYLNGGNVYLAYGAVSRNGSGNSGGGIYGDSNYSISVTGGAVSANTAGGNGGAIYVSSGGTFNFEGASCIESTGKSNNDVYLGKNDTDYAKVNITGSMTGSVALTPTEYNETNVYLSEKTSGLMKANFTHFRVNDNDTSDTTAWVINYDGKLVSGSSYANALSQIASASDNSTITMAGYITKDEMAGLKTKLKELYSNNSVRITLDLSRCVFTEGLAASSFSSCQCLLEVKLPEGLTELPNNLFLEAHNLAKVSLPSTITSIGERPFYECNCYITLGNGCTAYKIDDGALYTSDGKTLVLFTDRKSDVTSFTVPANVETIVDSAFSGASYLTSIDFAPDSNIQNIYWGAFYYCKGLTTISFPAKSDINFGRSICNDCDSLKNVIIPDGWTKIPADMFWNCSNLETIVIPVTVTNIQEGVTYNCVKFETIKYKGTQEQFNEININTNNNEYLVAAEKVYNYTGE
jgi:hypothetical protein